MKSIYYPCHQWRRVAPEQVGMSKARLQEAVAFAQANETDWDHDIAQVIEDNNKLEHPWNETLGPTQRRGGSAGLVIRRGLIVAEWGDTQRADMSFSISKSYLAIIAGIAFDGGLLPDVDAKVIDTAFDPSFETLQNCTITWRHLLQQTSEWEGELWGKPDRVDRNRDVTQDRAGSNRDRNLRAPGTFWEYNDVRVNRLALSLLQLFRRPLPDILKLHIMDPIGASSDWRWYGYRNSVIQIDEQPMQSVSGGGHWGGGLWASTFDHARFGYLLLRRGSWAGKRLLSEEWIWRMLSPQPLKPTYGYLWWLNTDRAYYPSAPASCVTAVGAGANAIFVDFSDDLVVVARWIKETAIDRLLRYVLASRN